MESSYLDEIKAILKSLVVSCPDSMTIDKLNRDFKCSEGYWIPYEKLGYRNVENFLNALKGTLVIRGSGGNATVGIVVSDNMKHVQRMVNDQKNTSRSRRINGSRKSTTYNTVKNSQQLAAKNQPKREELNIRRQYSQQIGNTRGRLQSSEKLATPFSRSNTFTEKQSDIKTSIQKPCSKTNWGFHNLSVAETTKINKSPIEEIVRNQSLCNSKDTQHYENIVNYGVFTSGECCKTNSKVINLSIGEASHGNKSQIKETVLVETLLNSKNTQQNNISRNSVSYGKGSCKEAHPNSGYTKRNFFTPSNQINDYDLDEAIPEFAADSLVFRVDFPENTVIFGSKIKPYEISGELEKNMVIKIFVTQVHNPFKFWFHINKENSGIDILMLHIERFYSKLDTKNYCIPLTCITAGQVCAALYQGHWHRGEILASPIEKRAKVYFIDYGTVSEVSTEHIKYLSTTFASISAQALRGSLSHIKPKRHHWEMTATEEFLSMVSERMVYGKITEIDFETRVAHMILCDSNKDTYVNINQTLIDKELASPDKDWENESLKQLFDDLI